MELALEKIQEWNVYKFKELNGYYLQDTWNLYEHPKFLSQSEDERNRFIKLGHGHYIHFERCNSLALREELKYWMYYLIEIVDKKITSLSSDITPTHNFIKFVNIYLPELESLQDKKIDTIVSLYNEFLQINGYKSEYSSASMITKEMKMKRYTYENGALTNLKRMHAVVNDYFNPSGSVKVLEYDKEKWDIRNLPFKVEFPPARPRYSISFLKIRQNAIKNYSKKYIYIRLKSKTYNTCVDDLKGINEFSEFLNENYPSVQHLSDLNRDILVDYISYIRTLPKLGITSKRARLGTLRTFLETCRFNEWDNIPPDLLMYDDDMKFKVKTLPNYYTDDEIRLINKHIAELPKQIAWMLFVIESVGMRVSELCSLKKDSLIKNSAGTYTLKYKQHKSNTFNTVPIVNEVAEVLKEAIFYAEEEHGKNVRYIFARTEKRYITADSFLEHINKLSYRNGLIGNGGKPLRLKSHGFRGTVATKYANLGLSQEVIRMMLGQKTMGSLKHYVEVHNGTVLEAMKDIIDIRNSMIENIGANTNFMQQPKSQNCGTPLPNGVCNKPLNSEPCNHANACYTCRMFNASSDYLAVYKHQLFEAERNISMAKMNKWERIEQINTELFDSLSKIINSLQEVNGVE